MIYHLKLCKSTQDHNKPFERKVVESEKEWWEVLLEWLQQYHYVEIERKE